MSRNSGWKVNNVSSTGPLQKAESECTLLNEVFVLFSVSYLSGAWLAIFVL